MYLTDLTFIDEGNPDFIVVEGSKNGILLFRVIMIYLYYILDSNVRANFSKVSNFMAIYLFLKNFPSYAILE
jgi:hypothetical protein